MILLEDFDEGRLNLYHASTRFSGYGCYTITVKLEYRGEYMSFASTTSNITAHDEATDLEGVEKAIALCDIIETDIKERVWDWILDVDYEEELRGN